MMFVASHNNGEKYDCYFNFHHHLGFINDNYISMHQNRFSEMLFTNAVINVPFEVFMFKTIDLNNECIKYWLTFLRSDDRTSKDRHID